MVKDFMLHKTRILNATNEIKELNDIDQTVFLVEILKNLPLNLIKYVSSVCNCLISKSNNQDSSILEEQANDLTYSQVLKQRPFETKLKMIQSYLPLLDVNLMNESLKKNYFEILNELYESCLKQDKYCYLNECRQVFLIAYLHPFFDENQKALFKKWIVSIENEELKFNNDTKLICQEADFVSLNYIPSIKISEASNNMSLISDSSEYIDLDYDALNSNQSLNKSIVDINKTSISRQHLNLKNSVSLPPFPDQNKQSLKNDDSFMFYPISKMNSTNSIVSNESIANNQLKKSNEVKNLPQWLKNLRLHKYTNFLTSLTYDELVNLNDDMLINMNITLGARKKILNNIEKLNKRSERIEELIKSFDSSVNMNDSSVKQVLDELTEISLTPMKPHNSPPTSLALLNDLCNKDFVSDEKLAENFNTSEILCKKIIELLEKIMVYLKEKKYNTDLNETETKDLNELVINYLKIIDKLFQTKAFSDVQNTQLFKLRNSFQEKSLSRSKSPLMNRNFNYSKGPNPANARLRIQNKNLKNALERTSSAPFNQN